MGTWYTAASSSQMDLSQIYESKFSEYAYTSSSGNTYNNLDFSAYSLVISPFWATESSNLTNFLKSSARFDSSGSNDYITLTLKNGLLPLDSASYAVVPSVATVNVATT